MSHFHFVEKQFLVRANAALLLTMVGGGLAVCAVGAMLYDISRLFGSW